MKFTIPGRLNGLNEMINAARSHWAIGRKEKREMTDICLAAVRSAKLKTIQAPVLIHFDWYEPDLRRDPDNVRAAVKYILDSLVEAGTLPRDSRKWILGLSDRFPEPDALNPRVEVTITEAA